MVDGAADALEDQDDPEQLVGVSHVASTLDAGRRAGIGPSGAFVATGRVGTGEEVASDGSIGQCDFGIAARLEPA